MGSADSDIDLSRNSIIMTTTATFIIVIFFMLVYYFAKRCQPQTEDTNNDVREQRGLDARFLKTIRVIQFDPKRFKEGLQCAVCLAEVKEGEKTRVLPKCDHGFHLECIDTWFRSHSTCPICRNPIVGDEVENHHKGMTSELASASSSLSSLIGIEIVTENTER